METDFKYLSCISVSLFSSKQLSRLEQAMAVESTGAKQGSTHKWNTGGNKQMKAMPVGAAKPRQKPCCNRHIET